MKEGKYLKITNLGRVVTELMKQRFSDIADLQFTAHMERKLDSVEEGKTPWKGVLREFYGDFEKSLKDAETALEGTRIKVPDEVSEEICPECGRNLVVKSGRFGRFLACPGYPDCSFTMPLVVVMPGRCPKCGGRIMKRTGVSKKTGKQYNYYCCEHRNAKDEAAKCDFMTWDVPVKDDCPVCGHTMFKRSGRGYKRPYCVNPVCSNFLPEDQRGYLKKASDEGGEPAGEAADAEKKPAAKKPAAKKTAAKKTTAKKTGSETAAAKKKAPAKTAKKPVDQAAGAEETAEKKPAAKKTAGKKPAAKKSAAGKTTVKKPAGKKAVPDEEI
ncbi:DNA topoisomerase 1 [bioreactor metagenome]|uniref:DNA topoisomerase 1 n=1 Tax=bioreactor metagenome TaxID=1076179 RepID=A0A645AV34_9ZZZZ